MTVRLWQLLLTEASVKEIEASIRKKFPGRDDVVDAVIGSGNPPALWPVIMRLVVQSNEPVAQVLSLIGSFNRTRQKLQKKDLAQYKDVQELQQAIEALAPSRADIKGQVEKIYEDENFVVVYPHSKEASCVWGKGTTWCTARTQSTNYFPYYAGGGNKLYYLITKGVDPQEDPDAKMSIGFDAEGKFSGGEDGGLSVNANNRGITWRDVIEQLATKADVRTRKKIISAIEAHASTSADHPLKGFYDKATQDPIAHRKFFDDAFNGASPLPYIEFLVLAPDEQFYPMFHFDMCVYLNQLLKKFGVGNEAFGELAVSPNLYTANGWTFPDDIDQGRLSQYISDALWLVGLGFSKLESNLKVPVVKFVNSIPLAMHIIETSNLDKRELRLIYRAKFLNQHEFHQVIRENALDMTLDPETRSKYQYIIEMFGSENLDVLTEIMLFLPDRQAALDSRLSAWFFEVGFSGMSLPANTINKVITQFIIPNLDNLTKSDRANMTPFAIAEKIAGLLGWNKELINQTYEAVSQLVFALGYENNAGLADKLIGVGIMYLDAAKHQTIQRLLAALVVSTGRRRIAMSLVSDTIDFIDADFRGGEVSLVHGIMRTLAQIARHFDGEYSGRNESPDYGVKWWRSDYLPPEYVAFKNTYKPEDSRNPLLPWPPPDLSTAGTTKLTEMLFARKNIRH